MQNNSPQRRGFLKLSLTALTFVGLAPLLTNTLGEKSRGKKIKMLNADGKLVEVDETLVAKLSEQQKRASNQDLKEWMNTSKI